MRVLDSPSYDRFDFKHYDEDPLSLDEAVRESEEMRKRDPGRIYRITTANTRGDRFRVESLSPLEVSADILARLSARWASMLARRSRPDA